jgi:hypothetical protein
LYIIGREGGRGGRIEILNGRQQKKKTDVALAFLAAIQFFSSSSVGLLCAVRTFVNNNKNKKLSSSYEEVEVGEVERKKEYIYKDE